ncbi:MAG TPA: murein biosynthesis integral membrane protein MurJ [Syntrophomonadaceae bacterium]|nr:murein biosynthesis integral membrane protein MurJ [Syntrophomonadaceae bacterium]
MKKDRLFKAAGIIAAASILSKILGYVREASIAAVFGASRATDAYLVASIIPWMLFAVVSAALTMTLIPVFTKRLYEAGEEAGERFINSLLNFVFLFCLVMAGLGALLAPLIVRIVAPGFRGETFALTVFLTRILLPVMIFFGIQAVLTGLLQARERFFWPAIVGIPFNIIMISAVVLGGKRYGIAAAAVGMVLATLSQLLIMAPGLARCRFRYRPILNLRDPGMIQVGRLIVPILLATGAGQLGLVVDRMLASGLAEGSIAALNFGNLVTQLPLGIFSVAVTTVLYPTFAQYAAAQDLAGLRRALVGGVRVILFLILPMTVGLITLREPIVRVLLERGAFDPRATGMTAYAVLFFSVGLIPMALRDAVNRVYFSLQDTLTPMLLGIGAVAVNIVLNLLLVKPLALGGLALSTSLATGFAVIQLLWSLRRRLGGLGGREMLDGFWRISVASAVMGLAVVALWRSLAGLAAGGTLLYAGCLGITICAGGVIYGIASFVLRLPEAELFLQFGRRLAWRLRAMLPRENISHQ